MKYDAILLILLIAFQVGCGSSPPQAGTDTKLQVGTKGLEMEIKSGVTDIVEGEGFAVALELRNEGFHDIEQGILIPSIEKDFLSIESWNLPGGFRSFLDDTVQFSLRGKSITNSQGEFQLPTLFLEAKEIDDTRKKVVSQVAFTACYAYKTTFSESICIDTDPYDTSIAEKTCTAKTITGSSQGAPIAVTSIKQRITPGKDQNTVGIELLIEAENKGDGRIVNPQKVIEVCKGNNFEASDVNTLTIDTVRFSWYEYKKGQDTELDCTPNPVVEKEDVFTFRCKLAKESGIPKSKLTFETPLIIELSYGYKETKPFELEILDKFET